MMCKTLDYVYGYATYISPSPHLYSDPAFMCTMKGSADKAQVANQSWDTDLIIFWLFKLEKPLSECLEDQK